MSRLLVLLLATIWVVQGQTDPTDKSETPESRIVGGRDAPDSYRPFQVSIREVDVVRDTRKHICSGTIITKDHVITAAHCLYRRSVGRLLCIAGGNDLNGHGEFYYVDSMKIHENYDDGFHYDLALMKMKKSFQFNKNIAAINIRYSTTPSNQNCEVSGWGYLKDFKSSSKLQVVNVTTTTFGDCYYAYQKFEGFTLASNQICTYKKDKGICYGDGGDPLTLGDELVGVASYMVPCAKTYPDVYVLLTKYKNWIQKNTS